MSNSIADRAIVIIEDSDEDYEVTVWALRQARVANPIYRCADTRAIAALLGDPAGWPRLLSAAYPLLILMDLNFPGMDWRETLADFRTAALWRPVPLIVISTSVQPDSVSACYCLGAAGYLKKQVDLDEFAETIRRVATYWLGTVVPPVPPTQASLRRAIV